MVHRTTKVTGFHLHAVDGPIGHVDDFLFDEKTWTVQYLVVDTSNWIGGRSVLISPRVVTAVDPVNRQIDVSMTREQIKASPSRDTADIPLVETLPTIWIM
jgi:PRC-barrel domain